VRHVADRRIAIQVDEVFGSVPGGGGQGRMIVDLVCELARQDRQTRYTLFAVRPMRPLPERWLDLPANFRLAAIPFAKPPVLFLSWHLWRWPPVEWWLGPQDVLHATSPNGIPARQQGQLAVTVHDLVWRHFPQGLKFWGRFFQRTGLEIACREAGALVAVSEATRTDILAWAPKAAPRVCVIPLAATPTLASTAAAPDDTPRLRGYGIQGAYLLAVGTIEPRKNHVRLVQAYAHLPADLRTQVQLVLAGPVGWKAPALAPLITKLKLEGQILLVGYVPESDLALLLRHAVALVYPSLYEGFGLPVLEAMSCGIPVITSRISSLPEVAGDAALLVEPTQLAALTEAMLQILTQPELRQQLAEAGYRQARKFSVERMARAYRGVYDQLCVLP
jgi:glycosyltransferase involved in cell wall biosynthesis